MAKTHLSAERPTMTLDELAAHTALTIPQINALAEALNSVVTADTGNPGPYPHGWLTETPATTHHD